MISYSLLHRFQSTLGVTLIIGGTLFAQMEASLSNETYPALFALSDHLHSVDPIIGFRDGPASPLPTARALAASYEHFGDAKLREQRFSESKLNAQNFTRFKTFEAPLLRPWQTIEISDESTVNNHAISAFGMELEAPIPASIALFGRIAYNCWTENSPPADSGVETTKFAVQPQSDVSDAPLPVGGELSSETANAEGNSVEPRPITLRRETLLRARVWENRRGVGYSKRRLDPSLRWRLRWSHRHYATRFDQPGEIKMFCATTPDVDNAASDSSGK